MQILSIRKIEIKYCIALFFYLFFKETWHPPSMSPLSME